MSLGTRTLDGAALADTINEATRLKLAESGVPCVLAVVLVGARPDSVSFVRAKERKAHELGITFRRVELPETASQDDVLAAVHQLNEDAAVDGIGTKERLCVCVCVCADLGDRSGAAAASSAH